MRCMSCRRLSISVICDNCHKKTVQTHCLGENSREHEDHQSVQIQHNRTVSADQTYSRRFPDIQIFCKTAHQTVFGAVFHWSAGESIFDRDR